jgi:hypothetical protein
MPFGTQKAAHPAWDRSLMGRPEISFETNPYGALRDGAPYPGLEGRGAI